MKRTIAIAVLALRSAIRSRLVLSLFIFLLLVLAGLPRAITGDGTLTGQIKVLLHYTLGATAFILGIVTLWAACGAVSQEIKEKQIHLVAVKPVHRVQIWLGKWLGLLAMNAALLCLVGLATSALVHWNLDSSKAGEEEIGKVRKEILTGRQPISPDFGAIDSEAAAEVDRLVAAGTLPPDMVRREALKAVKRDILASRLTLAPGHSMQWTFNLPAKMDKSHPVSARVRFYIPASDKRVEVSGTWTIESAGRPAAVVSKMEKNLSGIHSFDIPASAVPDGAQCVLKFNSAGGGNSGTIIFSTTHGIELLIEESTFGANLARALAVVFCQLALLAALGLTAGTMFSFPVATFVSMGILTISVLGHYFTVTSIPIQWSKSESTLVNVVGRTVLQKVNMVTGPALQPRPLDMLSDGIMVSWRMTGKAILLLAILYPALLGLAGGLILSRRELALPE